MKNIEGQEEERKDEEQKSILNNVSMAVNHDTAAKYADAGSEFVKAYTGKNYQAVGKQNVDMKQSLKKINNYKVNPNDADRNIKQHAGYAAEVMDVAERNAEAKIKGSSERVYRADDIQGHKVNETRNDIIYMDADGNEIMGVDGTPMGMQLKYVKMGKSAKETANQLISKEYREKYPDAEFCVAKGKYKGIYDELQTKEVNLQNQIDACLKKGNKEAAAAKQAELDYVKKVKKNLVEGKVTELEAQAGARQGVHWTAEKLNEYSNRAGIECAKSAGTMAFAFSFAKNLSGFLKGDIDEKTAVKNMAVDTAKGVASGYVTGYVNTAVSSVFMSSSNEALRTFATKCPDAPGYAIVLLTESMASIGKCLSGEITTEQCFKQIGSSALVMGGSIAGRAVGQMAGAKLGEIIGGTVGSALGPVGAMVGSFLGSIIVSTTINVVGAEIERWKYSKELLANAKDHYEEAKANYEELCKQLDEFDRQFRETYIAHTEYLKQVMGTSIMGMAYALKMDDADSFIVNANNITHALGKSTQFNSVNEFKTMVKNRVPLEL